MAGSWIYCCHPGQKLVKWQGERERATFLVLVLLKILRVTGKKNLAFPAYYSYSSSSGCCWDKRSITDFFGVFKKKSVV